jgi:heat shock protein HslJ
MTTRARTCLTLLALAAAACGGGMSPGTDGTDGLIGAWQLREAAPAIEVPADARVTLTVDEDDGGLRAGGTAACNSYGGRLDAADGSWSLTQLAVTEMGCDEPRMAAERAYLDALVLVDAWAVEAEVLTLTGPGVELVLDRLAPVEPAALTDTTWVLDGFVSGSGDGAAVTSPTAGVDAAELRLDGDGTFTLFTGCRDFAGDWTTSGDEVVFPSWGQTDDSRGVGADGTQDCGAEAEEQERAVLATLEGAFAPTVDGQRLTVAQDGAGLVFVADETG